MLHVRYLSETGLPEHEHDVAKGGALELAAVHEDTETARTYNRRPYAFRLVYDRTVDCMSEIMLAWARGSSV